jgi:hypothetical protein
VSVRQRESVGLRGGKGAAAVGGQDRNNGNRAPRDNDNSLGLGVADAESVIGAQRAGSGEGAQVQEAILPFAPEVEIHRAKPEPVRLSHQPGSLYGRYEVRVSGVRLCVLNGMVDGCATPIGVE